MKKANNINRDYATYAYVPAPAQFHLCAVCLVTQLCPTLCDPMDCSPPDSSVHGDSPGGNTGAGCHALLQGIFPTQGLNPGLLHGRLILYCQPPREAQFHLYHFCFMMECMLDFLFGWVRPGVSNLWNLMAGDLR